MYAHHQQGPGDRCGADDQQEGGMLLTGWYACDIIVYIYHNPVGGLKIMQDLINLAIPSTQE